MLKISGRSLLRVLLIGLIITIFYPRYLADYAGVPSRLGDYASHVNIAEHVRKGILFPSILGIEVGGTHDDHSISKYLPIYHGILGFHLGALLIEALGLPLPGAYGFLMDLCLAILLIFCGREISRSPVSRFEKTAAIFVFALLFLPTFFRAVDLSFFPQVLSMSLLLVVYEIWKSKWRGPIALSLGMGCLLFAAICYPDFLLWLLPVLIFCLGRKYFAIPSVLMGILCLVFFAVILDRLHLSGPEAPGLFAFVAFLFVLTFFGRELYRQDRLTSLLFLSFAGTGILILALSYRFGGFSYYSHKLLFPSGILLFCLLLRVQSFGKPAGRVFWILFVCAYLYAQDWPTDAYRNYFSPPVAYNNAMYLKQRQSETFGAELKAKAECRGQGILILPEPADNASAYAELRSMMRSSLEPNFEITDKSFIDRDLDALYSESPRDNSFRAFLAEETQALDSKAFVARIKSAEARMLQFDFCVAAPLALRESFEELPFFRILGATDSQVFFRYQNN